MEARRHRRLHVLRHARHHSRRPPGLCAFLRPGVLGQGSLVSHQGLGRRHVVPRRLVRRDDRVRDFCRAPQAPHRRRVRFRRAAAGHRHLRRCASATSSTASCGASRPTCPGPSSSTAVPRHATQLYEAALEGVVLFVVLWWYTAKPRPRMAPVGPVPRHLLARRASSWSSGACRTSTSATSPAAGSPWECC